MPKLLDLKFLADEGFSFSITSALKNRGFNIKWVGNPDSGKWTVYDDDGNKRFPFPGIERRAQQF